MVEALSKFLDDCISAGGNGYVVKTNGVMIAEKDYAVPSGNHLASLFNITMIPNTPLLKSIPE